MKCQIVKDTRLLEYLYGSMPDQEARRFKAHLARCKACRTETQELQKIVMALDAAMENKH